ncbi:MAG: ankyrin repeat domain-containing protein [Limisphaerales bacterium]
MKRSFLLAAIVMFLVSTVVRGDVDSRFQYIFGGHDRRIRNMKAETLFDSRLQIDLAKAAQRGDAKKIAQLVSNGADVNQTGRYGMRPLFWAIINKNINGTRTLLEHGADPNAMVDVSALRLRWMTTDPNRLQKNEKLIRTDIRPFGAHDPRVANALSLAALIDNPIFIEELIKHGADPNAVIPHFGETPIFQAVEANYFKNVSVLHAHGAAIDWQDLWGNTVFDLAVGRTDSKMALSLYKLGANPRIRDNTGFNALEVIKRMEQNGGPPWNKKDFKKLLLELRKDGMLE